MAHAVTSCPSCALGREVQREFWTRDFELNAAAALLPFLLVILATWPLERALLRGEMTTRPRGIGPIVLAGGLLGCGLGALFDGIVLHQILQWHNMLSSVRPPTDLPTMKYNMLWDGVFHAVAWLVTAAGVAQLWRVARRSQALFSSKAFGGALLAGWGGFNVVEGVIDHHLLQLHHVRPGYLEHAWDLGFLAWGAIMLVAGVILVRRADPHHSLHLAY